MGKREERMEVLCFTFLLLLCFLYSFPPATSSSASFIQDHGILTTASYQLLSSSNNPPPITLPPSHPPTLKPPYLRLRNLLGNKFHIQADVMLRNTLQIRITLHPNHESAAHIISPTVADVPANRWTIHFLLNDTGKTITVPLFNHKLPSGFQGIVSEWDVSDNHLTHFKTSIGNSSHRVVYDVTEPEYYWKIR